MSSRLTTRLAGVVALGLLAALAALVVFALAIAALRDSADDVRHAERIVATATRVQLRVVDAETAIRGYAITGRSSYLAPLSRAEDELPEATAQLRALTEGSPQQAAIADQLGQLVQDHLGEWASPMAEAIESDPAAARRAIAEGAGKRRVDTIRMLVGRLTAVAQLEATARTRSAEREADGALAFAAVAALASLLIAVLFVGYLQRAVAGPLARAARAATAVGAGDLDQRLPQSDRSDEVGRLAASFNAMVERLRASAFELEQQHAELEAQNAELERQATELERQALELEHQAQELEERHIEVVETNARLRERGAELEQLAEGLRRIQERTAVFARVSTHASALRTVPERALVALDAALELSRGGIGAVWTIHEAGDQPVLAGARGIAPGDLPAEPADASSAAARALATASTVLVQHGGSKLRVRSFGRELPVHREIHLPLVHAGRTIGVMSIGCSEETVWDQDDIVALERLAEQAAVFLDNAAQTELARWLADLNRSVLDATNDGIQLVGPDGSTILLNHAMRTFATEVLGFPVSVAEGTERPGPGGAHIEDIAEFVATRTTDPAGFRERWREIQANPAFEGTDEFQLAGSRRWFSRYTAPVEGADGEAIGRIFVTRETTEQREAQRVKDELMATVSHELRTPLAAILGFTELLSTREYGEDERREYLGTIARQAARLSALVDDFLDLQRLEQAARPLQLRRVDLHALLTEQAELFAHQSDRHTVEVELTDERAAEVTADADRLRRAVANLLSNAIKYSPQGGRVAVTAATRNGALEIAVSDEGIGVPADARDRLFERFYRVDNSATSQIGGTGLGLALVREVAEAHGGEAGVDSVEGQGSRFWFTIPRR